MLSSTRHEVRIVQLLGLAEAGQRFQQLGDARGWCAVETSRDLRGGDGDGCRRERGADGLRLVGHTRRPGEAGARLLIRLVSGEVFFDECVLGETCPWRGDHFQRVVWA